MEKYQQNILIFLLLASVWPLAVYPVGQSTEASRTVAVAMDVMNGSDGDGSVEDGSNGDSDVAGDGFRIKEIDIPESGGASAYMQHSFIVEGNNAGDIRNGKWTFFLTSADGDEVTVETAEDGIRFDVAPVSELDGYRVDDDGSLSGKIVFNGDIGGRSVDLAYDVTLDLKPSILNVSFVKQDNVGRDSYNVECEVRYVGADYLYVTLEEEYGSTARSQFVREPYLAHFSCRSITSPYYAWIDIVAENKYGRDLYTIELPPYVQADIDNRNVRIDPDGSREIRVFDIGGQYIRTMNALSETRSLPGGLYILRFCEGGEVVRTSKVLVR